MKTRYFHTLATTVVAVALLSATTTHAATRDRTESRINDEIESCATAFKGRIDLAGVQRIRHVVTTAKPAIIGREFTLETSTFTGDQERRYRAKCIVNGANPPLKLRVVELTG